MSIHQQKDEAPVKAAPKPVAKAAAAPAPKPAPAPAKAAPVTSRSKAPEPDSKPAKPSGLAALFGWGAKAVDADDGDRVPPARKPAAAPARPARWDRLR